MADYYYKGRRRSDLELVEGKVSAGDDTAARTLIQNQGVILLSLSSRMNSSSVSSSTLPKTANQKKSKKVYSTYFRKKKSKHLFRIFPNKGLSLRSLLLFFDEMATLLDSGVDLLRALEIMEDQDLDEQLSEIVSDLKSCIRSGQSLSVAMEKYPQSFSKMVINFVNIGEQNSRLALVFEKVSERFREVERLRKVVKGALTYPAFLLLISVGVVIFFMVKIVPMFSGFLAGRELPATTRAVMAVSNFLRHYFLFLAVGVGGLVASFYAILRVYRYRLLFDRLVLKIPLFGSIILYSRLEVFSSYLSLMLETGIPIVKSLDNLSSGLGNFYFESIVSRLKDGVKSGDLLSSQIRQQPVCPSLLFHLVQVGEETGKLGHMLLKFSHYCRQFIDARVSVMSTLLEPMVMLIMGLITGFLVISMFLPIFSMNMSFLN